MNIISEMIAQRISGPIASQLSQRLGVSESTAQTAVHLAVPVILAALARNASKPQGAQELHQAVASDHDGSILDQLSSYLGNPQAANGSGILGHVLGGQRPVVENNLAQATGLDQNSAGSLLEMLAPMVMGAVGREQQQKGLDPNGLSEFLVQQQQAEVQSNPGLMGTLSSMLDSNRDGSVTDDLSRMAGGFFK
ncbi:MAG TPA: DUF937 domain-containing protein [Pyrinomonadaceae bacterium]|nr:DUF937 domain-containing protein [Pyrinomonadaceae bacterium]